MVKHDIITYTLQVCNSIGFICVFMCAFKVFSYSWFLYYTVLRIFSVLQTFIHIPMK